ncbi:alpha/beta-hydrolase [Polyplosphaeria fusca]|uniref:Carboxylic ester hydrolase n=1 Tax=Polyplosphaeria fusca TaxID=682080 RepID=A0A9P4UUE6_9PLEO|nr:alpha/beta-hydrolase [Polyplosphaeria fusca]
MPGPILLAATLLIAAVAASPFAHIKNGLVLGSTSGNVDTFLGIPYADPPVGNLRLRRPQPLSKPLGTFNATVVPRACPQKILTGEVPIFDTLPDAIREAYVNANATINSTGEDCLSINVQRPANTTRGAKLPVLFWIYGGAWEDGATVNSDYSAVVSTSITLGEPVIVVAANYRLNTFGYLGGKELKAEGNTNLGLRDQRLALEWVQEHIEAFGGDSNKVTLWGQSAGGVSVLNHLMIHGGNRTSKRSGRPLFRAGIMHSAAEFPALPVDSEPAQSLYDLTVSRAGCSNASSTTDCLRALPYEQLLDATNSLPYLFSPEGFRLRYVPRPDDSDDFFTAAEYESGAGIADVPLIIGHQEDEATVFSVPTSEVTSSEKLVSTLLTWIPNGSRATLDGLVKFYNGDEETGAPFRTNSSQNAYPNSKINSAVTSDLLFIFRIRSFISKLVGPLPVDKHSSPVWSYQATYLHGYPYLGTFHGSDLALFASAGALAQVAYDDIVGRYVRFVNSGVPDSPSGKEAWPVYDGKKQLLQFTADGEDVIVDDAREEAYKYFITVQNQLKY